MSKTIRPVIETWGEPAWATVPSNYLMDFLTFLAYRANSHFSVQETEDIYRIWIDKGREVINLMANEEGLKALFEDFLESDALSSLEDCEDSEDSEDNNKLNWEAQLKNLVAVSEKWRQFIVPDGTLVLYLDLA